MNGVIRAMNGVIPANQAHEIKMRSHNSHKRVRVTGGAGFLGPHLCERLIADGKDVLCVDNYFIGTRANSRTCSETLFTSSKKWIAMAADPRNEVIDA